MTRPLDTPDPGGVAAGGPNLYQFVRSNPITFKDSDGGFAFLIPPVAYGTWTAGEIVVGAIFGTVVFISASFAAHAAYDRLKREFPIGIILNGTIRSRKHIERSLPRGNLY